MHPEGSDSYALSRLAPSGYREKLKQENPTKWMNFMSREKDRVRKERAILRERDDEQARLKKERIRIQNRLRKRKERQRKREREIREPVESRKLLVESRKFPGQSCIRNMVNVKTTRPLLHLALPETNQTFDFKQSW